MAKIAGLCVAAGLSLLLAACGPKKPAGPPLADGPKLFVSNEHDDQIAVLDPVSLNVLRRLNLGARPRGMALSPDQRILYVALASDPLASDSQGRSGVGVIDLQAFTLKTVIKTDPDPETLALSPDGESLFVSDEDTSEAAWFDAKTGTVKARFKVGAEPEGEAVSPDGKLLAVACEAANAVYLIDLAGQKTIGIVPVDARPRTLVFADQTRLFVTNQNGAEVSLIDVPTMRVRAVAVIPGPPGAPAGTARPMGLALSSDHGQLYVSTGRGGAVVEINAATMQVARSFDGVGQRPWGIGLSSDGARLYTANGPSNDVAVIDLGSGAIRKGPAGASPWGVVFAPR